MSAILLRQPRGRTAAEPPLEVFFRGVDGIMVRAPAASIFRSHKPVDRRERGMAELLREVVAFKAKKK